MKSIGIIDYGLGNLGSVHSAFRFYNYKVSFVSSPEDLNKVDIIVIAGVGNFSATVSRLKKFKLWDVLKKDIPAIGKPVLGICVGMQLFADFGYEDGRNEGLGWIAGEVVKMDGRSMRIPHIGWNRVEPKEKKLFKNMRYNFFYFMHSYHFVPQDKNLIIGTTKYCGSDITSVIKKDNLLGVQFHPEKSQGDGLRFLKNFVESFP